MNGHIYVGSSVTSMASSSACWSHIRLPPLCLTCRHEIWRCNEPGSDLVHQLQCNDDSLHHAIQPSVCVYQHHAVSSPHWRENHIPCNWALMAASPKQSTILRAAVTSPSALPFPSTDTVAKQYHLFLYLLRFDGSKRCVGSILILCFAADKFSFLSTSRLPVVVFRHQWWYVHIKAIFLYWHDPLSFPIKQPRAKSLAPEPLGFSNLDYRRLQVQIFRRDTWDVSLITQKARAGARATNLDHHHRL